MSIRIRVAGVVTGLALSLASGTAAAAPLVTAGPQPAVAGSVAPLIETPAKPRPRPAKRAPATLEPGQAESPERKPAKRTSGKPATRTKPSKPAKTKPAKIKPAKIKPAKAGHPTKSAPPQPGSVSKPKGAARGSHEIPPKISPKPAAKLPAPRGAAPVGRQPALPPASAAPHRLPRSDRSRVPDAALALGAASPAAGRDAGLGSLAEVGADSVPSSETQADEDLPNSAAIPVTESTGGPSAGSVFRALALGLLGVVAGAWLLLLLLFAAGRRRRRNRRRAEGDRAGESPARAQMRSTSA